MFVWNRGDVSRSPKVARLVTNISGYDTFSGIILALAE